MPFGIFYSQLEDYCMILINVSWFNMLIIILPKWKQMVQWRTISSIIISLKLVRAKQCRYRSECFFFLISAPGWDGGGGGEGEKKEALQVTKPINAIRKIKV